jgi:hypothetical protein
VVPIQCKKLVYNFVEHNISHSSNSSIKKDGDDWLTNFISKYKLSLRISESTSIRHLMSFNKPNIETYISLLKKLSLKYKFEASQIFNINETGISTVPNKLPKVLSPTGSRRVAKLYLVKEGKI